MVPNRVSHLLQPKAPSFQQVVWKYIEIQTKLMEKMTCQSVQQRKWRYMESVLILSLILVYHITPMATCFPCAYSASDDNWVLFVHHCFQFTVSHVFERKFQIKTAPNSTIFFRKKVKSSFLFIYLFLLCLFCCWLVRYTSPPPFFFAGGGGRGELLFGKGGGGGSV